MTKEKKDGLYLLALGAAVFLLLGVALQSAASDSREDFRAVVYGARCLLHHCDPYNEKDLFRYYQQEFAEPYASHLRSHTLTLYINLPATILVVTPLAILPFCLASILWSLLTAASLMLAAFLMWDLASKYAPVLSGALIALSLASGAIVLGNGNPAGIVVAFALVGVWCFVRERFVLAGVLCLAVSLALKPHDAGLVWLCLLLVGGPLRRRALQTLLVTALLSLVAVLWVSIVASRWLPELRSNMATMSGSGGNNDAGLTGPTSQKRATEMIVNLQSAVSVFRDDPKVYNTVSYLVCGMLLLLWLIVILRSPRSPAYTWLALAAIAPLTMLVTYHRAYDTRLLMLTVPACGMLLAEKGATGRLALIVTALGITFTGELPYALLKLVTPSPPVTPVTLSQKMQTLLLARPASLFLLLMAVFYLWIYLHRALGAQSRANPPEPSEALI